MYIQNDLSAVEIKAELLSHGVRLTHSLLSHYGSPFLQKRRAYGNSDPLELRQAAVPQEFYIGAERLICAVNVRPNSPWTLDWQDGQFCVYRVGGAPIPVTFPLHPRYYDEADSSGFHPSNVVTLYGGGALGIFIYGDCALVTAKKACQYCSIEPNRAKSSDFLQVISPDTVYRAVRASIELDDGTLSQVMLNGGNFPDLDRSFSYYVGIAEAARRAVDDARSDLPVHLIAFPPNDLNLLRELKPLNVEVAFNTEVYDPALFARYCPGKQDAGGRDHIFRALEAAVDTLGKGNAYSIFVGGLEELPSMQLGLDAVAKMGATPVINVFHADPETPLSTHPLPTPERILAMGAALQETYATYGIERPFYSGCGRNSIDSEASSGLFLETIVA